MPLVRNLKNAGFSLILATAAPALACSVPDDGSAPLRGAVTRVKHLPETEAWQKALPEGTIAQFVLFVDSPPQDPRNLLLAGGGACPRRTVEALFRLGRRQARGEGLIAAV